MSGRHRFRFFVDRAGAAGDRLPLAPADARHLRVLRLADGDEVEVVDALGDAWDARVAGDAEVELVVRRGPSSEPATIELYAGALTGSKFDELVDGAVQAGATTITPVAGSGRGLERLRARRARLDRIARAAAKQSKRSLVPQVGMPIVPEELPAAGILLDASAPETLDRVVAGSSGAEPIRLLVGGAEGIEARLVDRLVAGGWQRARLGPTILRAELAAPVAVAIAAMLAPSRAAAERDG